MMIKHLDTTGTQKNNTSKTLAGTKNHYYLLAPLLSGILLIAAFPPFEQGYLAWVALIPLIWSSLQTPLRKAFWPGFLFALPLQLYLNLYLAHVLFLFLPTMLALAAMAGLVLYISFFYGLFSLAASLAARSGKSWFTILAVPSLWTLMEYLRSLGFMAYNVGYIGYTQWGYPGILGLVSVYGYWGLPFLMVFLQTMITSGLQKKPRGAELMALAVFFAVLFFAGLYLPSLQALEASSNPLQVALIQGNIAPEEVIAGNREKIVNRYLDLTRQSLEIDPTVKLVVWPETVASINHQEKDKSLAPISKTAGELNIHLLFGARIRENEHLYNAVALYSPGQEKLPFYYKHRLVPFVEFFPLEEQLNRILDLQLLLGRYSTGDEITIFKVGETRLGSVICFESYFGDHMRLFAAKGAEHLFIPTNDAWFGQSIGLDLHAQVAAIRAAESGVGVTQVANSGITISFDCLGRELFRSGKEETGIFILPLDLVRRHTYYVKYGDYFPLFWALFLLISVPCLLYQRKLNNPLCRSLLPEEKGKKQCKKPGLSRMVKNLK